MLRSTCSISTSVFNVCKSFCVSTTLFIYTFRSCLHFIIICILSRAVQSQIDTIWMITTFHSQMKRCSPRASDTVFYSHEGNSFFESREHHSLFLFDAFIILMISLKSCEIHYTIVCPCYSLRIWMEFGMIKQITLPITSSNMTILKWDFIHDSEWYSLLSRQDLSLFT